MYSFPYIYYIPCGFLQDEPMIVHYKWINLNIEHVCEMLFLWWCCFGFLVFSFLVFWLIVMEKMNENQEGLRDCCIDRPRCEYMTIWQYLLYTLKPILHKHLQPHFTLPFEINSLKQNKTKHCDHMVNPKLEVGWLQWVISLEHAPTKLGNWPCIQAMVV